SFDDSATESVKARNILADATGANPEVTITALVSPKQVASADALRSRVEEVANELRQDPAVRHVITAYNSGFRDLISTDGKASYLPISTEPLTPRGERKVAERLDKRFSDEPDVKLAGPIIANWEA